MGAMGAGVPGRVLTRTGIEGILSHEFVLLKWGSTGLTDVCGVGRDQTSPLPGLIPWLRVFLFTSQLLSGFHRVFPFIDPNSANPPFSRPFGWGECRIRRCLILVAKNVTESVIILHRRNGLVSIHVIPGFGLRVDPLICFRI